MPERSRPPTSADVAARAGVSRTTVSFVLNRRPGVQISAGTRSRVLEAARELGYRPHPGARHLASGRTSLVSLVLRQTPDQIASDAFLAETVRGLSESMSGDGYRITIDSIPHGNGELGDLVRTQHLDGIVLSGPRFDDADLKALLADDFPVVIQGSLPGAHGTSVDVDNFAGAREAVLHLVAMGRGRIAFVSNGPLEYTVAQQRLDGYRAGLAEMSIPFDESLVAYGAFDAPSGHRAIDAIIGRGTHFDAVFAASDVVALGVIGGLNLSGRTIPDDVALVGFDDIPVAAYLHPPLTTIRVPAFDLGLTAGRALLDVIGGRPVPARTLLPTELIVRGSTSGAASPAQGGPAP